MIIKNTITPINCCGEYPVFYAPDDGKDGLCNCLEKIECSICGRVIYSSDDESVEEWNNDISGDRLMIK